MAVSIKTSTNNMSDVVCAQIVVLLQFLPIYKLSTPLPVVLTRDTRDNSRGTGPDRILICSPAEAYLTRSDYLIGILPIFYMWTLEKIKSVIPITFCKCGKSILNFTDAAWLLLPNPGNSGRGHAGYHRE